MPISNLISEDAYIDEDGKVHGTLTHIDNFEGFSSIESEQEGYYLPIVLDDSITGTEMTFKKNGAISKANIGFDPEIIWRVAPNDIWKIEIDGTEVLTVDLSTATFAE